MNIARQFIFLIVTLSLGFSLPAMAAGKPSKSAIKKAVKTTNRKYTNIKTTSKGVKRYDRLGKIYVWSQYVEARYKKSKGVTVIVSGPVEFHSKSGSSKWQFQGFNVTGRSFKGIPNPTEKEILKVINGNLDMFFSGFQVKSYKEPTLSPQPRFKWESENKVEVVLDVEMEVQKSYTDLETIKQELRLTMFQDGVKKPWKSSNIFTSSRNLKSEVLSKRTVTSEEMKAIPSWKSIRASKAAAKTMAALPKLELPTFTTAQILRDELYKYLREGDAKKIESFLYQSFDRSLFSAPNILNAQSKKMMGWAIKNATSPAFKDLYCDVARVDTNRSKDTEHYIRSIKMPAEFGTPPIIYVRMNQSKGGFVNGKRVMGEWKINQINVGNNAHKDFGAYAKSLNDRKDVCSTN